MKQDYLYHLELFYTELLVQRVVQDPRASVVLSAFGLITKLRGTEFTITMDLLRRATSLDDADLDRGIDRLEELGIVTLVRCGDELCVAMHCDVLAEALSRCFGWMRSVVSEMVFGCDTVVPVVTGGVPGEVR